MGVLLTIACAAATADGDAGGSGGQADQSEAGGQPGLPGCDGGTDLSPDGRFYVLRTTQECNPGEGDRLELQQ